MIKLDQFHLDTVLLRQIKQAERQAAREAEEDDDDDPAPRGTQRNRPADIDDEEEEENDSVGVKADRRATITRVKRERQQSRGPSIAPGTQESSGLGEDTDAMDED